MKSGFMNLTNEKIFQILISAAIFISGCLCFILSDRILRYLPYILGTILILLGILRYYNALADRHYSSDEAYIVGNGTLYLVLGVLILIKNQDSFYMIGIVWGMFGLIRDSRNITDQFFKLVQKEDMFRDVWLKMAYYLFGIVISILLLTDPPEHLHFHIMVLGLELFDSSFRVLRDGLMGTHIRI